MKLANSSSGIVVIPVLPVASKRNNEVQEAA
jgi:hypothetical protein